MKKFHVAFLAALASAGVLASPAYAVTVTTAQVGQSTGDVAFNGFVNEVVVPGLSSTFNFTLTSVDTDTDTWVFGYTITNTSNATGTNVVVASRISGWGFNTDPGA